MTETEELGRSGRLHGGAAGELVAAAYAAESAHGPRLARGMSLADLAHAVALVEGGDLAGDDARALVRGLLELHAIPGGEFPWDPSVGDAFNAREAELERRVGTAAAYTYLQPAQPTTVGHLLLTYAYPALRDADRLRASYNALGASVAGAGGSAGSRWALDRTRLADLLGCDGVIEHAKDAAWQAGFYLEP